MPYDYSPTEQSRRAKIRWGDLTPKQRFMSKVNKTDTCWLWVGAGAHNNSYGKFRLDKMIDAHRASWLLFKGHIPDNLQVCHTCDVKLCVNPDHLFLGTQLENMQDMVKKGRQAKDKALNHHPQNGENNYNAKYSVETIVLAKQMLGDGKRQCDVMRATGLTRANVWAIAHGKSWK